MDRLKSPLLGADGPSPVFGRGPWASVNHNVVVGIALAIMSSLAESIWQGTVLTKFIFESTGGHNVLVGYADAARGLTALLVAIPLGVVADRSRNYVAIIAAGGLLAPLAAALTLAAVSRSSAASSDDENARDEMPLLLAALCAWSAVQTARVGPVQALFASSTRRGERSHYYTLSFSLGNYAIVAGRVLTIGVFAALGDTWSLGR